MELLSQKLSDMIYQNYIDLTRLYHVMVGFGILLGVMVMLNLMVRNGFRLRVPKQLSRMQVSGVYGSKWIKLQCSIFSQRDLLPTS